MVAMSALDNMIGHGTRDSRRRERVLVVDGVVAA
jgi:hypothetical protein